MSSIIASLKRLNASRTAGPWDYVSPQLGQMSYTDAIFLAAAANAMGKLLELTDAVKEMGSAAWDSRVRDAIKALDEEMP